MARRRRETVTDPSVGLCGDCRHALSQTSARGQGFWRCLRAQSDESFRRYPPLPVEECHGFERRVEGAGGVG